MRARQVVGCCVAIAGAGCGQGASNGPPPPPSQYPTPQGGSPYAGARFTPAAGHSTVVGATTWSLDQLAPAPLDSPTPQYLYAVLRVSTTAPSTTLHTASVSMVDDANSVWSPVPVTAYQPIDALDGLTISPQHSGAGTVAFSLPPGRHPVGLVISVDGVQGGIASAP